jgi:hypothetical protein
LSKIFFSFSAISKIITHALHAQSEEAFTFVCVCSAALSLSRVEISLKKKETKKRQTPEMFRVYLGFRKCENFFFQTWHRQLLVRYKTTQKRRDEGV